MRVPVTWEPSPESYSEAPAARNSQELNRVLMAVAVGMLGSKPVCRLREEDCRRLAELAVEAFKASLGEGDDGEVRFVIFALFSLPRENSA